MGLTLGTQLPESRGHVSSILDPCCPARGQWQSRQRDSVVSWGPPQHMQSMSGGRYTTASRSRAVSWQCRPHQAHRSAFSWGPPGGGAATPCDEHGNPLSPISSPSCLQGKYGAKEDRAPQLTLLSRWTSKDRERGATCTVHRPLPRPYLPPPLSRDPPPSLVFGHSAPVHSPQGSLPLNKLFPPLLGGGGWQSAPGVAPRVRQSWT